MVTMKSSPRITPDMTPAQRRRAVRSMLRELATVLHATRRISRQIRWPLAAGVS
jgi:hypothetical protein